jgi:glycosyltransferase involved in cell wall biosynthesis
MTIGISTAFLGNLRAGTWTYTWQLLQGLATHADICALDREERLLPGLPGIQSRSFPGGGDRLAKLLWPNFVLPGRAAVAGCALVHCTTPYGTFMPCKYRNVITICDVTPLLFPGTHGRMNVWHHRFALPEILRRADRIVTISECSKRDIVRMYGVAAEKVTVTLLAADERFRLNPAGAPGTAVAELPRPYILNVGTLEPRKNLDGLLRAFAAARRQGLSQALVITGARGWGKSRLAPLVAELGIADAVVFTGFVEDGDLPHLYAGADFFVYPSLYEGFGLPPLEAMACGTPVVTANCSSLPEVTGDAALLVDPRSEAELAAAMLRLAGDLDLRQDLRQRGLARAAEFSWAKTVATTWQVYQEVLAWT